jgi:hypothetical protein
VEPEAPALLSPVERDVPPHQIGEGQLGRLGAIDDGPGDVGSEIGQPDQTADIGPRAVVLAGEFVQRPAVLQSPAQVTCPGQLCLPKTLSTRQWTGRSDSLGGMTSFLGLLLHALASPFKSQARLEAEIVFLRHQLNLHLPKISSRRLIAFQSGKLLTE